MAKVNTYSIAVLLLWLSSTGAIAQKSRLDKKDWKKSGEFGTITDHEIAQMKKTLERAKKDSEKFKVDSKNRYQKSVTKAMQQVRYGLKGSGDKVKAGSDLNIKFTEFHEQGISGITSHQVRSKKNTKSNSGNSDLEMIANQSADVEGGLTDKPLVNKAREKAMGLCKKMPEGDPKKLCKMRIVKGEKTAAMYKKPLADCDKNFSKKLEASACKKFVMQFEYSGNYVDRGSVHQKGSFEDHRVVEYSEEFIRNAKKVGEEYASQMMDETVTAFGEDVDKVGFNYDLAKENLGAKFAEVIEDAKMKATYMSAQKVARGLGIENIAIGSVIHDENATEKIADLIIETKAIKENNDPDKLEKEKQELASNYRSQIIGCLSQESYCAVERFDDLKDNNGKRYKFNDLAKSEGDVGRGFDDVREYYAKEFLAGVDMPLEQFYTRIQNNSDFNDATDSRTTTKPYQQYRDSVGSWVSSANDLYNGITAEVENEDGESVNITNFGGADYVWANPQRATMKDLLRRQFDSEGRAIGSTINTGGILSEEEDGSTSPL